MINSTTEFDKGPAPTKETIIDAIVNAAKVLDEAEEKALRCPSCGRKRSLCLVIGYGIVPVCENLRCKEYKIVLIPDQHNPRVDISKLEAP